VSEDPRAAPSAAPRDAPGRLVRAGILTALSDFLFASFLSMVVYDSTFSRLWQGVASVPLGRQALEMGNRAVAIGLLLHLAVAFTWSALFLFVVMRSSRVRRVLESPGGVLKAATVYGPVIWLVMSLVVIPTFTGRPPTITSRWWVNLVGHIPFVALPMIWMLARRPTPR
jgi:hypothetical protein